MESLEYGPPSLTRVVPRCRAMSNPLALSDVTLKQTTPATKKQNGAVSNLFPLLDSVLSSGSLYVPGPSGGSKI